MQSASTGLSLLGFLFLFAALVAAAYLYLPWRGRGTAAPAPSRSLEAWAAPADRAEHYGPGHALRVAELAERLAVAIDLPVELRASLRKAALLHDVGQLDFEPELLARAGLLGRDELQRLSGHAALGAAKVQDITGDTAAAQWVRWHHERWDGLGYPDGLAGAAIPLPARILRLADSADALLNKRPYREAFAGTEVLGELARLAGVAYDPVLARVFVNDVLPAYLTDRVSASPEASPDIS